MVAGSAVGDDKRVPQRIILHAHGGGIHRIKLLSGRAGDPVDIACQNAPEESAVDRFFLPFLTSLVQIGQHGDDMPPAVDMGRDDLALIGLGVDILDQFIVGLIVFAALPLVGIGLFGRRKLAQVVGAQVIDGLVEQDHVPLNGSILHAAAILQVACHELAAHGRVESLQLRAIGAGRDDTGLLAHGGFDKGLRQDLGGLDHVPCVAACLVAFHLGHLAMSLEHRLGLQGLQDVHIHLGLVLIQDLSLQIAHDGILEGLDEIALAVGLLLAQRVGLHPVKDRRVQGIRQIQRGAGIPYLLGKAIQTLGIGADIAACLTLARDILAFQLLHIAVDGSNAAGQRIVEGVESGAQTLYILDRSAVNICIKEGGPVAVGLRVERAERIPQPALGLLDLGAVDDGLPAGGLLHVIELEELIRGLDMVLGLGHIESLFLKGSPVAFDLADLLLIHILPALQRAQQVAQEIADGVGVDELVLIAVFVHPVFQTELILSAGAVLFILEQVEDQVLAHAGRAVDGGILVAQQGLVQLQELLAERAVVALLVALVAQTAQLRIDGVQQRADLTLLHGDLVVQIAVQGQQILIPRGTALHKAVRLIRDAEVADAGAEGLALGSLAVDGLDVVDIALEFGHGNALVALAAVGLLLLVVLVIHLQPLVGDAFLCPAQGQVFLHVIIGVDQQGGAGARKAVAAAVIDDLADDIILGGIAALAGGRNGHAVDAVGRVLLIFRKAVQLHSVQVLGIEQEAEIHGLAGVLIQFAGARAGRNEMEIVLLGQGAVILAHKGIDLADGSIGIGAQIVLLALGLDDAVKDLRQQEEAADDGRALLQTGGHKVADVHGNGQDEAGAGAAAETAYQDHAGCLREPLPLQLVQLLNGLVQRSHFALLDGSVQRQTGDRAHLTGAFGQGLTVQHLIHGEPCIAGVAVHVQIFAHGQAGGGLDGVDLRRACLDLAQLVDIGIKDHEPDVLPLSRGSLLVYLLDDL